jgi:hypothetical protein
MLGLEEFLTPYIGAPYKWCLTEDGGKPESRAPFWRTSTVPTPEEVKQEGCCCVGLINLVRLWKHQSTFAGTKHITNEFWMKLNPITRELPFGAMLLRFYRDMTDQGHVAIVWKNQQLLHCYTVKEGLSGPGIVLDPSWSMSHSWNSNGYYDVYIALEDWLPQRCRCLGGHSCSTSVL